MNAAQEFNRALNDARASSAHIGLSDYEIKKYSFSRLIYAMANPHDRAA